MRHIRIPRAVIERAISPTLFCKHVVMPVKVDWPELQLTDEQQLTNSAARVNGQEPPFPDQSVFDIELERTPLPHCYANGGRGSSRLRLLKIHPGSILRGLPQWPDWKLPADTIVESWGVAEDGRFVLVISSAEFGEVPDCALIPEHMA
jgi:hypothetical protein